MVTVTAIRCNECGDTIFSRARHDWRTCSCGCTWIDGGFEYVRFGGKPSCEPYKLDVYVLKKELYDDWNRGTDRYGLIKEREDVSVGKNNKGK